jgi:hypothetical protein
VYIIELENIPKQDGDDEHKVELDIHSANNQKMEHDFYLVLRSPSDVKWVVRSHRIQGWIDIVVCMFDGFVFVNLFVICFDMIFASFLIVSRREMNLLKL